jgi:hypothetical protein
MVLARRRVALLVTAATEGRQPREERGAPGMNILGLNAFHGDSSAPLIRDGVLVAAAASQYSGSQGAFLASANEAAMNSKRRTLLLATCTRRMSGST